MGQNSTVYIAVAFFTHSQFIKNLVSNNCKVYLIIRLGFPTNAHHLKEISNLDNVFIRFYTGTEFHPKLYVFDESGAFVGSSNLTGSGIHTNQELNIFIEPEDPVFETLKEIFFDYWEHASPLTIDVLNKYDAITWDIKVAIAAP